MRVSDESMFLEPRIKRCESLKDLLDSPEDPGFFDEDSDGIDTVLRSQRAFLISEPGYGKSSVLLQIIEKSQKANESCIYIDLKTITNKSLCALIKDNEEVYTSQGAIDDFSRKPIFQTSKFRAKNSREVIFCLDALDEVRQEYFSETVDEIKRFIAKYDKATIILTCRKNYLAKWQHLFADQSLEFFSLLCFNSDQIRSYLVAEGIAEETVEIVLEKMNFRNRLPILRVPRYLGMLARFVKKEGAEALIGITRGRLFDFFIDENLRNEQEKVDLNKNAIIKKVLEKLALVMEIYQTSQISKNELMEFFDDVQSNLSISFLNQVPIEILYERSLLKENPETVEFVNTEFQEYLAAKEICRLGKTDQVVFDLMVIKELHEIHPSWINTLSFLLEEDISLLPDIIKYIAKKSSLENYHALLPITGVDKLTILAKGKIFQSILTNYCDNGHWIDHNVARNLSWYFDSTQHKFLDSLFSSKNNDETFGEVIKANVLLLIGYISERGLLSVKQSGVWQQRIIDTIGSPYQNEVLLRFSITALGAFKNPTLFSTRLADIIFATKEDTIISGLIYAIEDSDSLTSDAINCILRGIEMGNISARLLLPRITDKPAINNVVDSLITNEKLLVEFLDHESIHVRDTEKILKNLEKVTDEHLLVKLKKLFNRFFSDSTYFDAQHSKFVLGLAVLIDKKSPGFIFELIATYKDTDFLHALPSIFAALLKADDVKEFSEQMSKHRWIAFNTVYIAASAQTDVAKGIEAEGRKCMNDEFTSSDKSQVKTTHIDAKRERDVYQLFKYKLEPEQKKYSLDLFQYYRGQENIIEKYISTEEKERLIYLVIDALQVFDPGTQKLTITNRAEGSSQYTTNQFIHVFGDALSVAADLNVNVSHLRQHIVNYIPFSYSEHLKAIFHLVKRPTKDEIVLLLKIYKNRADDLREFMPSSLIEFVQVHQLSEAVMILKSFVNSEKVSSFDRCAAFNTIVGLDGETKLYARLIFNKYRNSRKPAEILLRDSANAHLIEKYSVSDAVNWRIEKLIEKAEPFKRVKGVHAVGKLEGELMDKNFAKPLYALKGSAYRKLFLDLIERALEVHGKSEEYHDYASYLWSISIEYFRNLKQAKSYESLHDIEELIERNKEQSGINWFLYTYQNLKREYAIFIGKPNNIADCIKQYNYFKTSSYLVVSTSDDLFRIIMGACNDKIRSWVESEGAYHLIRTYPKAEDLIQKTIKTQLTNCLLEAGLRKEEIQVQRESQLLDDKRTDFLVYYGFIGPILIEVKLSDNPEITNGGKRLQYRKKLLQYLDGTASHRGIYLVFLLKSEDLRFDTILKNQYKNDRIEVVSLICKPKSIIG